MMNMTEGEIAKTLTGVHTERWLSVFVSIKFAYLHTFCHDKVSACSLDKV